MNDYYATLVNANCLISRNVLLAEGYSYRGIAKYHLKDASFVLILKLAVIMAILELANITKIIAIRNNSVHCVIASF